MTITLRNVAFTGGVGASVSTSLEVLAGDNRVLISGLCFRQPDNNTSTSVTYDGVPLDLIIRRGQGTGNFDPGAELHLMPDPPVGTHDLVGTIQADAGRPQLGGIQYDNVDQATIHRVPDGEDHTSGPSLSTTVESQNGDLVVVAFYQPSSNACPWALTDGNVRWERCVTTGSSGGGGDIDGGAGAATTVEAISQGGATRMALVAAALIPAGEPGPGDDPVLTNPTASATGPTTATGSVDTDTGSGTLYWVVTQSSTAPSVSQVQAGQDHNGNPGAASGNQAVVAAGTQTADASGLEPETTYYFHFQQHVPEG